MRTLLTNKAELVEAHRAEDWERAKKLSQERERLKRQEVPRCQWPGCGQTLSNRNRGAVHCRMHWIVSRYYKKTLAAAATAAVLMLLAGCAHYPVPGVDQYEHRRAPLPPPVLPAPETRAQPKILAPAMVAAAAPLSSITLAWTNVGACSGWATGLRGSTNLTDWYLVAKMPYREGQVVVTLSNRPPAEFYRAFNASLGL